MKKMNFLPENSAEKHFHAMAKKSTAPTSVMCNSSLTISNP